MNKGDQQTQMEWYQTRGKVDVLNSKIDFNQSFKSNLHILTKCTNIPPGTIYVQTWDSNDANSKKKTVDALGARGPQQHPNKCTRLKGTEPPNKFDPKLTSTPSKHRPNENTA